MMATKLETLLKKIDPSRTYVDISSKVNRGFNSFAMPKRIISSYEEYENVMSGFFGHIEKTVFRIGSGTQLDKEFYWTRCSNILDKAYGLNAYHTVFSIIKTGKEGGLYGVFKKVADLMAEEYAQNHINYEIHTYWNNLTIDEKLAAPEEYLRKYGHLLPNEMTEDKAPRVKAFFVKILEEHPKLMRRMRKFAR
jgi:hypothetical protein